MASASAALAQRNKYCGERRGIITPVLLGMLTLISLLLLGGMRAGTQMQRKIELQVTADLTALSISREQAQLLNALALLNQQIHLATLAARGILISWASLASCAAACTVGAGCPCLPPLMVYNQRAPGLLRRLQQAAQRCADLQDLLLRGADLQIQRTAMALGRTAEEKNLVSLQTPGLLVERLTPSALAGPQAISLWQMPAELKLQTNFAIRQRLKVKLRQDSVSGTLLVTEAWARVTSNQHGLLQNMRRADFEGVLAKQPQSTLTAGLP